MKTQIFGTFGPACATEEILKKMIEAGMTGMRLNLSHVTLEDSQDYIRSYTNACEKFEPQILIDLQGPELRVKKLEEPVMLTGNQTIRFCISEEAAKENEEKMQPKIPVPAEVLHALETGDEVLLDDGKLLVEMVEGAWCQNGEVSDGTYKKARVLRGGILHGKKSIKIIGKNISLSPLTEHDLSNLAVSKDYGVTAVMQPFVQSGEDVRYVRKTLKEKGAEDIQIFAKIENRLGVENLADILTEADVIVIARGDLGNDMPLWELPRVQKEIESACHKAQKPYIVVTQMLASMEQNPVPTRAEVSDIFHAVYHGAWGVMLTGETAIGQYPVEAITYLSKTVAQAEAKK